MAGGGGAWDYDSNEIGAVGERREALERGSGDDERWGGGGDERWGRGGRIERA